jgi:hypothetical protein
LFVAHQLVGPAADW